MNKRIKKLLQLFIFIFLFTFFFGINNVFAATHEFELKKVSCKSGNCLRNTEKEKIKGTNNYYTSVQSMTITKDNFVVAYSFRNSEGKDTNAMFYVIDKSTFKVVKKVHMDGKCGHANGLTYNPNQGENGILVCVNGIDQKYIVYDAKTFKYIKTIDIGFHVNNLDYDKDTNTYWAVRNEGNGIYQYDTNFNIIKKISSSEIESYNYVSKDSSGNDKIVPYRLNQDAVIHNGYIYLINYPGSTGTSGYSRMLPNAIATDAIFLTYNLKTWKKGDLLYNRKSKRDGVTINEIEDMAFNGETPYLLYQQGGKFEIFTVAKKQNINAKVTTKVKTNNDTDFNKLKMTATFKSTTDNFSINKKVDYSSGNYTLSKINLTKPGTYKLEITQGKTSSNNWTIDKKKITATIKVKCGLDLDNLTYKVSYANGDNTFNNTFKYDAIEVPISVKTTTTKPSEYDINLSAELYDKNNKKLETAKEEKDKYTFKKQSIKEPGTYTYTIKQKNSGTTTSGVYTQTIDNSTITVTVKVTASNGKLSSKVTYSKNSFTNKVTANYNKVTQNVSVIIKTNKNDSSIPTPTTKLNVYKGTKLVKTVSSSNGEYNFGIDLTSPGTYKYTLKQDTSVTGSGVYSYVLDTTTINLTIDAKVKNNQLTTTKTLSASTYTNKVNVNYNEINVPIQVQIENLAPSGVTFPTTKAVLSGTGTNETINSANGRYSHTLKFKRAGTYTYTMKQKNISSNDDVEYDIDDTKITITVVVTNNNGVLTSNVTYSSNKFYNTATVNVDPINLTLSANIETTKTNTSVATPQTTATLYSGNTQVKTASSAKSKYTFSNIQIAAAGTYTYTIKQNSVSLSDPNMRLTLDNNTITVTVKVTEGTNGLTAKTTYSTKTFNNSLSYTYGSINVDIVYNIDETNPELKQQEPSASIYQDNNKLNTVTASNNKYSFRLSYNTPGTYKYKVSQDNCGTKKTNNVVSSIDCDVKELIVTVKESGNSLTSSINYRYNDTTFENVYVNAHEALNIPISIDINNNKSNTSIPTPSTSATISSINGVGELEEIETVQNINDKYTFKEIEVIEPGTYSYIVTQDNSGKRKEGIYIYDISKAVIVFKVKVREENNKLVYEIDNDDLSFENTIEIDYTPISIPLMVNISDNNASITKTMVFASNKRVLEKKEFTNNSSLTASNIQVKRPGEYVYYIYIQKPHNFVKNNTKVELDSSIIQATVTVTANANNALSYSIVYSKGTSTQQTLYTLTNRYTTISEEDSKDITTPITIDINSNSDDISSIPTTASLYENGIPIETVTNTNGRYQFESLSFNKVGKYSYKIKQQDYEDQSWSIDDEEIELEVNVYENEEGALEYSLQFANDVSSFTNNDDTILETPNDPDSDRNEVINVPDTGLFKAHFIELFGLLITISGIGIFYKVKRD